MSEAPATKGDLLELEHRLDGRMGELEERLDGRMGELEHRLDGRMGELEQRIDGRMGELEQRIDGRMGELEKRLDGRILQGEESLKEFMRDIETNMLTAFHSYAQSNDLRLRKVEADLNNFNTGETLRLAAIENRLLAVEQKVHTLGRS